MSAILDINFGAFWRFEPKSESVERSDPQCELFVFNILSTLCQLLTCVLNSAMDENPGGKNKAYDVCKNMIGEHRYTI